MGKPTKIEVSIHGVIMTASLKKEIASAVGAAVIGKLANAGLKHDIMMGVPKAIGNDLAVTIQKVLASSPN